MGVVVNFLRSVNNGLERIHIAVLHYKIDCLVSHAILCQLFNACSLRPGLIPYLLGVALCLQNYLLCLPLRLPNSFVSLPLRLNNISMLLCTHSLNIYLIVKFCFFGQAQRALKLRRRLYLLHLDHLHEDAPPSDLLLERDLELGDPARVFDYIV